MLRSQKLFFTFMMIISQLFTVACAANPEEVLNHHLQSVHHCYLKSRAEIEQSTYSNYLPGETYQISLADYYNDDNYQQQPRTADKESYWKLYIAMEALDIIKREDMDGIKILNTEHIKALLSIPAITNDWYVIIQHPALRNLSAERKQQLLKTLTKVKVTAEDNEKIKALHHILAE